MTTRAILDEVECYWDGRQWKPCDPTASLPNLCHCQSCGRIFLLDFIVPDNVWDEIKPKGKPTGAGLLCGSCIVLRLEKRQAGPGVFHIVEMR